MKSIIVDTSIWIGAFIKKDKYHENGEKFLQWLQKENNIRVIIPIGVIYEVIARIQNISSGGGFENANKALELFLKHEKCEIYYNTEESFQEVQEIFKKYKKFSLVDSTIVLLYVNKKCSLLISTDSDYNLCSFINRLEYPI